MDDFDDLDAKIDAADRFTRMAAEELAQCEQRARVGGLVVPRYRVVWCTRGRTAGWCLYPCHTKVPGLYELRFNAHLAANEGEGFRDTVAHELAHAITYAQHGRAVPAHGLDWQLVMYTLGHKPSRCHNYASTRYAADRNQY